MCGHVPALSAPAKFNQLSVRLQGLVRLCSKYQDRVAETGGEELPTGSRGTHTGDDDGPAARKDDDTAGTAPTLVRTLTEDLEIEMEMHDEEKEKWPEEASGSAGANSVGKPGRRK